MPDSPTSRQAQPTEKMIEVRIRFWTNNIAQKQGEIVPKHAWDSGMVAMERNESHGIRPAKPKPFHTLLDLPAMLEELMIENEIKFHPSRKTKKYFVSGP
jgi:hypothetical protein